MMSVKQRAAEKVKTCPIDRPRSTTPINPTTLEEFVASPHHEESLFSPRDRMQIVLPRFISFITFLYFPRNNLSFDFNIGWSNIFCTLFCSSLWGLSRKPIKQTRKWYETLARKALTSVKFEMILTKVLTYKFKFRLF